MRRASGIVLIGVGLFAVVLAILLPTVVVDRSKKTPLDLNITQLSTAKGAKVLDAASQQLRTVDLRATRVVKTDTKASDSKYTTVYETLCVLIIQGKTPNCVPKDDPRFLSATQDRVTADRVSAESVHVAKWHEFVWDYGPKDTSVRHKGMTYKWPIDTKKKDYTFFMPDLRKAFPALYKGTDRVAGLKVYKFVVYSGVQPYKVNGLFDGTYEDTTTAWVEPLTGAVIYGEEHQIQKLADGTLALDATFKFDKSAVDYQANFSKDEINKLRLAQIWAPIALAVIAIASLVGAYFLLRTRRTGSGPDEAGEGRHSGPRPDDAPDYAEPPVWAGSPPPNE